MSDHRTLPRDKRLALTFLVALILGLELILTGADLGLWGHPTWRGWVSLALSFQPELLWGQSERWAGQTMVMFFSHVFLHVDLAHMTVNLVVLALLVQGLRDHIPDGAFWVIGFAATLGGALFFAVLGPENSLMTGASGALSGLAVAWVMAEIRGSDRKRALKTLVLVTGLTGLSVLIDVSLGHPSAWQAHLGGALTGGMLAAYVMAAGFFHPKNR